MLSGAAHWGISFLGCLTVGRAGGIVSRKKSTRLRGKLFTGMEHLEGRQSVLAALNARQRRFEVVLVRHDAHEEKVRDVIGLAEQLKVPVRRVAPAELDALSHGATHGGV